MARFETWSSKLQRAHKKIRKKVKIDETEYDSVVLAAKAIGVSSAHLTTRLKKFGRLPDGRVVSYIQKG